MAGPCVCVDPTEGETTRRRLAERDLVDGSRAITQADGRLYIPVVDEAAVPDDFDIVDFDAPPREPETTPADLLEFDPSYERIGDVIVVDEEPDRADALAEAVVASDLPAETVLNRASKIKGEQRVRDWEVLAGRGTETVHREYGHAFAVDLAEVYFSPRLATERHRVVEQIEPGENVVDMFAGVGPFAVPTASRGATVVAIDINETAIEYLRENADRNGVADTVRAVHGDVREVAADYRDWADRVIMNLPHRADEFLETAFELAADEAVLHYYDIEHEDDPFGPGEAAILAAAEATYTVDFETSRIVRSYAPHELNVVIDARVRYR